MIRVNGPRQALVIDSRSGCRVHSGWSLRTKCDMSSRNKSVIRMIQLDQPGCCNLQG